MHFPHPHCARFKKGHRLVVLPEYQGLGLGHEFSSIVAQMYIDQGYRFIITSNTKALYDQRKRDPRWAITRIGRLSNTSATANQALKKSDSTNRITISYEYLGRKK